MGNRELKKYLRQSLQQSLQQDIEPETEANGKSVRKPDRKSDKEPNENALRLEETVKLCTEIMRKQKLAKRAREEERTDFVRYLSDMFRFEGLPVFGLQAAVLFIICLAISTVAGVPGFIPVFIPLFVLAVMPVLFKGQYYGMSEMEAVTRASGSQIVLARLILAGAANLVCMTVLISFEVYHQNSYSELGQMILYCLVPYLVCMGGMLRLIRLQRRENIELCVVMMLGSCVCWGVLAKTLPWLYEASAFGIWIVAFLFFAVFFVKEVTFIITMRKEGKMYGVIA